jgi:hypothetical protein
MRRVAYCVNDGYEIDPEIVRGFDTFGIGVENVKTSGDTRVVQPPGRRYE